MATSAPWYTELCQSLDSLRQNGDLCDVILEGNDGRGVPCHSVILAAVSPYFKDTLVWSDEGCCKIKIGSVSSTVWECVVNFVYTGKVVTNSIAEVAAVVRKLRIPSLLKALQEYNNADSDYASTRTSHRSISSTPGTVASDLNLPFNFAFPSASQHIHPCYVQPSPSIAEMRPTEQLPINQESQPLTSLPNIPIDESYINPIIKTEPNSSEYEPIDATEYFLNSQNALRQNSSSENPAPPPSDAPPVREMPPLEPLPGLKIQNVTSILHIVPAAPAPEQQQSVAEKQPLAPPHPLGEIPYPPRNRKKQTCRKSTSPRKVSVPPSPVSSTTPSMDEPKRGPGRPKGSRNRREGKSDDNASADAPSTSTELVSGNTKIRVIGSGTLDQPLGAPVDEDNKPKLGRGRGNPVDAKGQGRGRGRAKGQCIKKIGTVRNFYRTASKKVINPRFAAQFDDADLLDSDPNSVENVGKKTRFKCKFCTVTFETMAELYNHKATKHIVGGYSCKVCKQVFTAPAYLMQHKKSAHDIDVIKRRKYKYVPIRSRRISAAVISAGSVPEPDKLIPKLEALPGEQAASPGIDDHKCDQCSEIFVTAARLKFHKKFNHRKTVKERTKSVLPQHKGHVGRPKNECYGCTQCERFFRSPAQLRWHRIREHDNEEPLIVTKIEPDDSVSEQPEEMKTTGITSSTENKEDLEKSVTLPLSSNNKLVETKELSVKLVPIDNLAGMLPDLIDGSVDAYKVSAMTVKGCEEGQVVGFGGVESAGPKLNATSGNGSTSSTSKGNAEEEFPFSAKSSTPMDSTCPICSKVFNTPIQLHWHKVKCHREESLIGAEAYAASRPARQYRCKVCSRVFGSPGALRWHRVHKHGFHDGRKPKPLCLGKGPKDAQPKSSKASDEVLPSSLTSRPRFSCEVCKKTFMFEDNYTRHRKMHGLQARFKCPECDARFTRKDNMKFHFHNKHAEKPMPVFTSLRKTPATTENPKSPNHPPVKVAPFKCQLCQKSFCQKASLMQHIKVKHEGIKEHQCPKCSKSFSHRFSMERHAQSYCHVTSPVSTPVTSEPSTDTANPQ